jgi:hypothetical protein
MWLTSLLAAPDPLKTTDRDVQSCVHWLDGHLGEGCQLRTANAKDAGVSNGIHWMVMWHLQTEDAVCQQMKGVVQQMKGVVCEQMKGAVWKQMKSFAPAVDLQGSTS